MILQFFRKYPFAIISYTIYILFWCLILRTDWRYEKALSHISAGERVAWGEGVMYGDLLVLACGIGTAGLLLLLALIRWEKRGLYLIMSILVATPVILYLYFSNFLGN